MSTKGNWYLKAIGIITISVIFFQQAYSQAELQPWGNFAGIRINGALMQFETSLIVAGKNWKPVTATGKEKQRPKYIRYGKEQIVTTNIDSIYFTEKVTDATKGEAKINVAFTAKGDENIDGVFFCLTLPEEYNSLSAMQINKAKTILLSSSMDSLSNYLQSTATSIRFTSPAQQLLLTFTNAVTLTIKKQSGNAGNHLQIYIPIHVGDVKNGQSVQKDITITATGQIDSRPVAIKLNTKKTGNKFDGFGGNFRLQNAADPMVIDYCLNNMRVAWGRVEMPWRFWQPVKNSNPIDSAKNGRLNLNVQHAMEMAQRLSKMNIPIILSAWSAPAWAVIGKPKFQPGPDGVWGNPLNKDSMQEIYKSIADYIVYLKDNYAVEIKLFSFNESDLGINIRLTAQEHADLIKGLGAYLLKRGLKTKMLLGDNSDATTYQFIYPAINDAATLPFIGAVSFHSWRGCDKATLQKWASAAAKINRPLLVAEGSIDAQAWGYPAIFEEPTYALQEIDLYIRLLATCQPLSILQWQLTSDYSPLAGGGIFGNNEALRPTQRFFNLKQLAATPKGLKAMSISSNRENVSVAALGDNQQGIYVLHLVNNGPARVVNIKGLPAKLSGLKINITDKERGMKEGKTIKVINGAASFKVEAGTFTSLTSVDENGELKR